MFEYVTGLCECLSHTQPDKLDKASSLVALGWGLWRRMPTSRALTYAADVSLDRRGCSPVIERLLFAVFLGSSDHALTTRVRS